MILRLKKEYVPPLMLAMLASLWTYFYSFDMWLNDYGATKPDWLLLVDIVFLIPLVCLLCIKNIKEALLKSVVYGSLLILLGSLVIPETSKTIWHAIDLIRYVALAVLVLFETITLYTVFFAIKASLELRKDPDLVISKHIVGTFGDNWFSNIFDVHFIHA